MDVLHYQSHRCIFVMYTKLSFKQVIIMFIIFIFKIINLQAALTMRTIPHFIYRFLKEINHCFDLKANLEADLEYLANFINLSNYFLLTLPSYCYNQNALRLKYFIKNSTINVRRFSEQLNYLLMYFYSSFILQRIIF
jgi:hypothetical protein